MQMYLTSEEQAIFSQIPSSLQSAVEVVDETISSSAIESDEILNERRRTSPLLADAEKVRILKSYLDPLLTEQALDEGLIDFETGNELLFLTGVNRLTVIIKQLLGVCTSADALTVLSQLTVGRHDLIEVNMHSLLSA